MRSLTWIARLGLVVAAGALLVTAVVVAIGPRMWQIANAHEELPVELPEFQPLAQRSYAYDVHGTEIAVFEAENSQPVPLSQVPDHVIAAFLSVEDREFYAHDGVNIRSLVRATLSNFSAEGDQQGASTITMQVVKNDFLAGLERDGRYKLLQVHYALMLDRAKTKDEILERYLNTVFFGNNAYGIQAAAETYFGTTVDQLDFIQAAFLAGLVRAPSGYDPVANPERSRSRFMQVLERLVEDAYITEAEAETIGTDFVLPDRPRTTRRYERTYFTEALRDYLLNRSNLLGETYDERYAALFRGGLRIHTTLDSNLQGLAEQARNVLPDTEQGFDASIVTLDTASGAIRTMVGGRGFVPNERETNMALAPRQTGSSIKLFVLAAAIQAGAQANDLIDGASNCSFDVPNDDEPFVIRNAVDRATDTLSRMTWSSINCAYVRLSQIVGLNRVVDTTYRMAQSAYLYPGQPDDQRDPIQPFISYSTGANEMSPLDMAAGGQTIANAGLHHEPYYVEAIDTAGGRRIYEHASEGTQVLDRPAALTTVDVLKGVLTDGTARSWPLAGGRPAAGKTGTQADNTNAWFVGFTPQLTTAVWVGDPNGYTPMVNVPEFGGNNANRVQGGRYPAQIWKTFMDPAHLALPRLDWPAPPPPSREPARLYLPGNECVAGSRAADEATEDEEEPAGFANPRTPPTPPAQPAAPTDPPAEQAPPTAAAPAETDPPEAESQTPPDNDGGDSDNQSDNQSEDESDNDSSPRNTTPRVTRPPIQTGTTIDPDNLDPRAPMPSVPRDVSIVSC